MIIGSVADINIASERVAKFYADNWAKPIVLSDKKFYDWQFKYTPSNGGEDSCVVAYDETNDAVAGVMGLNKRDFYLSGERLRGAELTTWIVDEKYRSTGAGAKILKKITEDYEILIGMGISQAALPIYLRSGFRYIKQIPRFVKVLNYEAIKSVCEVDSIGLKLLNSWKGLSSAKYISKEFVGSDVDAAFDSFKSGVNLFSRYFTDIEWRYINHPYFNYKIFFVKGDGSDVGAVVVFRIHEPREGFKVLHLMDIYGDSNSINAGRSFVEDYSLSNSVDVIDFYCTSSEVYRHFISNNWFSICDDNCFKFPHLFSPTEMRTPPTTSLIYWASERFSELANLSKLYVTKQDADLDRPTPYDFPI